MKFLDIMCLSLFLLTIAVGVQALDLKSFIDKAGKIAEVVDEDKHDKSTIAFSVANDGEYDEVCSVDLEEGLINRELSLRLCTVMQKEIDLYKSESE